MGIDDISRKHEDLWFHERDKQLIEQHKRERERRIKEEKEKEERRVREELKKAHWMRCPKCGHELHEKELTRVKIDICTRCEGIFFDRGELEQVMMMRQGEERKNFFRRLIGLGAD